MPSLPAQGPLSPLQQSPNACPFFAGVEGCQEGGPCGLPSDPSLDEERWQAGRDARNLTLDRQGVRGQVSGNFLHRDRPKKEKGKKGKRAILKGNDARQPDKPELALGRSNSDTVRVLAHTRMRIVCVLRTSTPYPRRPCKVLVLCTLLLVVLALVIRGFHDI